LKPRNPTLLWPRYYGLVETGDDLDFFDEIYGGLLNGHAWEEMRGFEVNCAGKEIREASSWKRKRGGVPQGWGTTAPYLVT